MATQVSLNSGAVASAGALALQTNGTTEAVSISTGQVATFAQNPILTSGTANGVAYLNGSKALTTGSALVFDGTNLGIGTSSPNCKFEVKGGSAITTLANSYSNAGILHQYSSSILLAIGSDGTNPVMQGVNATNNTAKDILLQPLGGNLGLGVTPSASTYPTIESAVGIWAGRTETNNVSNAYFGGSWKYIASSVAATRYSQSSGQHQWYTAASGTAGNAITFTQAMTLDASGNLALGTTSALSSLYRLTSTGGRVAFTGNSDGLNLYMRYNSSTVGAFIGSPAANVLAFSDSDGTERARIDSSGNLLVGVTSTIGTGKFQVRGGIFGDNSSVDQNLNIECRTGGTLYSNSIYSSTTAVGASVSITGTAGYLQRSTSSIKYKTDVENMDSTKSESIYQMRPVWYRSKCATDRKDWSYYGLIAEEIAEIEPRLVHWGEVKEDGTQEPEGVMYDRLTVLLLSEIKKQQAIITQLQADVAALKGAKA